MMEIRLLAPTGMLGSGFLRSSLEIAMEDEPHIICCDSGSTDGGPHYLGTSAAYFPVALYERDLRELLGVRQKANIPLVIGSAGGAGTNAGVDFIAELCRRIARENGYQFRLARIYAEQPKKFIGKMLRDRRIRPLWPSDELTEETVDRTTRIVAMMGPEPIRAALQAGSEVIVAGRASDSALFAAYPFPHDFELGPIWHAGKILECGAAATVKRTTPDCLMAAVRSDHFVVRPPNPQMRCTELSVAAHSLYENADPYRNVEPGGILITDGCTYEAVDERSVRVSDSRFEKTTPYTFKLEGAAAVGYASCSFAGIRDPFIIRHYAEFESEVINRSRQRIEETFGLRPSDYQLSLLAYGRNAILGAREPEIEGEHEIGLLIRAVAKSQEQANVIVSTTHYLALHNPVKGWTGMVSNLASPFAPELIPRGLVYTFCLNHVVEADDPVGMFRTEFEMVKS